MCRAASPPPSPLHLSSRPFRHGPRPAAALANRRLRRGGGAQRGGSRKPRSPGRRGGTWGWAASSALGPGVCDALLPARARAPPPVSSLSRGRIF